MKKGKRSVGSIIGFTLYVVSIIFPLSYFIGMILQSENRFLFMPLLMCVIAFGVIGYKNYPKSILGRFIRAEPLILDRSNEEPYQYDNPYMAKKNPSKET